MSVAIRAITQIQEADDAPVLGAGQDGYALTWDNASGAFVATGLFTGGLLATGATTGSTTQAQSFGATGIKADVVAEHTSAAGVTIDGLLIKDGALPLWSAKTPRNISQTAAPSGCGNGGENAAGHPPTSGVTRMTYREKHTATCTCYNLRFLYSATQNFGQAAQDFILRAAVEVGPSPYQAVYPVSFSGRKSLTFEKGMTAMSDPVGIDIAKGGTFWLRTEVLLPGADGYAFPQNSQCVGARLEGIATDDVSAVDDTVWPGNEGPDGTNYWSFGPVQIYATPSQPQKTHILVLGDSNIAGGNIGGGVDPQPKLTWVHTWLNNAYNATVWGSPGDQLARWWSQAATARVTGGCLIPESITDAVVALGTNDYAADIPYYYPQGVWDWLHARGIRVWGCTVPPYTTALNAVVDAGHEAARVVHNTWVRTTPAPLVGYFDIAAVLESSLNSGAWNPTYLTGGDGIHFNTAGHTALAAALSKPSSWIVST